jgi:retron-type reverse transcriptase
MWRKVFRASDSTARLLTKLTTVNDHLPQGCPASNGIANLVLLPLAIELNELCATHNLRVSIYVDDVTISGPNARGILPEVIGLVRSHGFRVSSRKVAVMPRSARQEVTGNVVNRRLSNGSTKLRRLGGRLIAALRNGIGQPEFESLQGSVRHASHIAPKQARRLERLLAELSLRRSHLQSTDRPKPKSGV